MPCLFSGAGVFSYSRIIGLYSLATENICSIAYMRVIFVETETPGGRKYHYSPAYSRTLPLCSQSVMHTYSTFITVSL